MPPLPARRRTALRLKARAAQSAPQGPPSWGGSGWASGPIWIDAYQTRRAPTPVELVEGFKAVTWACNLLNQNGVARTRLGLYATTSEGQVKPKRWSCPTQPLRPAVKAMVRKAGTPNQCEAWIQRKAAAADVDEVVEHPLLEMLHRVNDDWDTDLLIRYLVACMDIVGWFFVLPEASGSSVAGRNVPDLLWPLLAQYVIPFRVSGGSLTQYYRYFSAEYEPKTLIRGRCVSLRDPYGLGYGPAQAAWAYIGLNDQFTSVQENLMTQGGRISGYLTDGDATNPIGKPEAERAEQRINATWTRGNSGRIPYLPGAFKFTPLAWPPRDLAELQISDNALLRIANCFGVPISLLKTEDVNRANADAGHLQHSKLAIDPRCHLIATALTRWARNYGEEHGLPGWDRLFFAFDNPVTEDAASNATIFNGYVDRGVMTRNEVRGELGYEPIDGGDELLVPGSLKTIEQVSNPPAPPPQLAPFGGKPAAPNNEEPSNEGEPTEDKKSLPFGRTADTKFNPNHDHHSGQFTAGHGGHGGGTHAAMSEEQVIDHADAEAERLADHPDPVAEIVQHAPPNADPREVRQFAREAREDLKEREKNAARDVRDAERDHAKEMQSTERELGKEKRDLDKEHAKERRNMAREHARGELEHEDETTHERDQRHAEERRQLVEDHAAAREQMESDHRDVRKNDDDYHRQSMEDLRQFHRDERKEWISTTIQQFHDQFVADADAGEDKGLTRKDLPDRDLPEAGGGGGGEKNTYGLPQGEPIRNALVRWFDRQRRAVLGVLPTIGAPLPAAIEGLTDWTDPMARAMTPLLSVYWDESGRQTMERLGLDPDDWRVVNPHLRAKIDQAAMNFCESTNASTSKRLDEALGTLRKELAQGMVAEGEGIRELTKRVQSVFEGLTKSHARLIAASEASRAVHAAQEAAAIESGVVAGFELLLSADACPLCRKVHDECKAVPIGQPFAVIGDHPNYSTIKYPPLHPACQCSLTEVLLPEFGGPANPQWGQTLEQPQDDDEGD